MEIAPTWKPNASTPSPTASRTCTRASRICGGIFDFGAKQSKLNEVDRALEDPAVWNDAARAQELGREKKSLEGVVVALSEIDQGLRDARELFEMARGENDDETLIAVESDAAELDKQVAALEFRRMFSNPADPNN